MTNNSIFNTILAIAGVAGITYAVTMHSKYAKVSERLDKTINDLANNMEIDISDEVINKAVEKAVNAAAKDAIIDATNAAVDEVQKDIRKHVAEAVAKEYASIKESVLRETTAAAAKIDVAKVQKDVEEAAKKAALEKFDAKLEDIVAKFQNDWDTTAKIYSTIQRMSANSYNPSRDFVVKFG